MKKIVSLLLCIWLLCGCQAKNVTERVHFSADDLPFSTDSYTYKEPPIANVQTPLLPLIEAAKGSIVNIKEHKKTQHIAVSSLDLALESTALGALSLLTEAMVTETATDKQLLISAAYSETEPLYPDFSDGLSVKISLFDENVYPIGQSQVLSESTFLEQNAAYYGFIFRYDPLYADQTGISDKAILRYVGAHAAQFMTQNALCLEQFLSLLSTTSPSRALCASFKGKTCYFFCVEKTTTEISFPPDSYFEIIPLSDNTLLAVIWDYTQSSLTPNGITVFLDAGHGALNEQGIADRGAGENSFYHQLSGKLESDLNLALSLAIKEALTEAGYTVIMSREGFYPKTMTIYDRAALANESGADIFISVHANSFSSETAYGSRVYYSQNQTNAKESGALAAAFSKAMNAYPGISGKQFSPESADYVVIRDTRIPAILIESCFLTNKEDAQNATNPAWIRAFAYATREGVDGYFDRRS